MDILLPILIIISSILLILVVLIQNSKGGGLDSNIASQTQVFGAQKTTELVEKITWWLAASLIVFSIASTKLVSTTNSFDNDNVDGIEAVDEESEGGEESEDGSEEY